MCKCFWRFNIIMNNVDNTLLRDERCGFMCNINMEKQFEARPNTSK